MFNETSGSPESASNLPSAETMDALPAEVLLQLFPYLCRSEIKRVRLVCASFAVIAEQCLFRNLVLTPHLPSFKKLESIACHQRLSSHVRALLYDRRWLLEGLDSYGKWLEHTDLCRDPFSL